MPIGYHYKLLISSMSLQPILIVTYSTLRNQRHLLTKHLSISIMMLRQIQESPFSLFSRLVHFIQSNKKLALCKFSGIPVFSTSRQEIFVIRAKKHQKFNLFTIYCIFSQILPDFVVWYFKGFIKFNDLSYLQITIFTKFYSISKEKVFRFIFFGKKITNIRYRRL